MSDDLITIDVSNIDLGQYALNTMQDTFDLTNSGYVLSNTSTITVSKPVTSITLDGNYDLGIGGWFEDQKILEEHREEKLLRENNEGIQKAWEAYKILVELAKNPPEII